MTYGANPYQPPKQSSISPPTPRNTLGGIGFSFSMLGVTGLFLIGWLGPFVTTIGMSAAFLCLPGLLVSFAGLLRRPRTLAGWGVALGLFGSSYLPTLYASMFVFSRN